MPQPGHPGRRIAAAVVAGLVSVPLAGVLPAQADPPRPPIRSLPDHLESIRADEATDLYGDPAIRPFDERRSAVLTMGDSEISGEGVGNYLPETHHDGNWCDRSYDQAVFQLTIDTDERYNIACSGARPEHLVYGGPHQWNELNQGDQLAIKARNTRLSLVWVVVGANGPGSIEFGPVATDCVLQRFFFLGTCYEEYTDVWRARTEVTREGVETALRDIRRTMTDAGYRNSDYELVVMGYPGPLSPDVEDNPDFPGWYGGGCLVYLHDAAFARNKAVPMFEWAMREAAWNTGTRYLDASRLFHGHEVCDQQPWVRGLHIELGIWDENAARQSMHPNRGGHYAFARCMDQFYASGAEQGTCVDVAGRSRPVMYPELIKFRQVRNRGAGWCIDAEGYDSRIRTQLFGHSCHGGRNQGFWYDTREQSIHIELSQDRCLDVRGGQAAPNKQVFLYECHGGDNQRFVLDGALIRAAVRPDLCVTLVSAAHDAQLRLVGCNPNDQLQRWDWLTRFFENPVGYNHSDFIGSRVY